MKSAIERLSISFNTNAETEKEILSYVKNKTNISSTVKNALLLYQAKEKNISNFKAMIRQVLIDDVIIIEDDKIINEELDIINYFLTIEEVLEYIQLFEPYHKHFNDRDYYSLSESID